MNKNDVAPVIVTLALCATIAGTILLFPVMRHLGRLLEAMTKERRAQPSAGDVSHQLGRVHELMESLSSRLALLEERQDFQDRLLSNGHGNRAAAGITDASGRRSASASAEFDPTAGSGPLGASVDAMGGGHVFHGQAE